MDSSATWQLHSKPLPGAPIHRSLNNIKSVVWHMTDHFSSYKMQIAGVFKGTLQKEFTQASGTSNKCFTVSTVDLHHKQSDFLHRHVLLYFLLSNEIKEDERTHLQAVCHRHAILRRWGRRLCKKLCDYDDDERNKKDGAKVELGYLRSPPALSAGPHMENQASGPLGTDVCSPLDSSQSATEAVQEPGPLTTTYTATSHSHLEQRERTLLIGWNTNKKTARKSTLSLMLTSPTCSKHITRAQLWSLGTTETQTLIYTSVIDQCTHKGLQDSLWYSIKCFVRSSLQISTMWETFWFVRAQPCFEKKINK